MELWRDAFFIYYMHRGFPEHLRDERKEKLGLNLKLGDGEMFPLENISSGRGLEAGERERGHTWAVVIDTLTLADTGKVCSLV